LVYESCCRLRLRSSIRAMNQQRLHPNDSAFSPYRIIGTEFISLPRIPQTQR
jgi:hypothetical protein